MYKQYPGQDRLEPDNKRKEKSIKKQQIDTIKVGVSSHNLFGICDKIQMKIFKIL